MSEDSDEDYMSAGILKQVVDVRPGLSRSKRKRGVARCPSKSIKKKSKQEKADEAREQALSVPLPCSNKGFSMLSKMGYKEGMGLGKQNDGIKIPVPIVVKNDKKGLGQKSFLDQKRVEKKQKETVAIDDFQRRKRDLFSRRALKGDLWKSQLACQQLDTQNGVDEPCESWFWPAKATQVTVDESSDEEKDEIEADEQVSILTAYLRSKYFYCIWCGTSYEDEDDLALNCPGDSGESHE